MATQNDLYGIVIKAAFLLICCGRFICQAQAVENPQDSENCRCGWTNPSRISGGTDAGVNEFPMMAGIVNLRDDYISCGATIISKKYVLTAAHCVGGRRFNITQVAVVVGEHDANTGKDTNATQTFKIRKIMKHPDFNSRHQYAQNDIAVLEIDGEMKYSARIGPVCLPFNHSNDTFAGEDVKVLGFGLLEADKTVADVLQKTTITVTTNRRCSVEYPDLLTSQLCVSSIRTYTCLMDGGGPILWRNPKTQNLVLIAVIGYGCHPIISVNERVGAHLKWIESVTPDATYCKIE